MKRWATVVEEVVPILLLIMKTVVSDTMIVIIHETVEHKIVTIPKTEEEKEDMTIVTTQEEMMTDMMIEAEMITSKMIIMKTRICRQRMTPTMMIRHGPLHDIAGRLVVGQEDHNIMILTTAEIHMIGIAGIRITYEEGKAR